MELLRQPQVPKAVNGVLHSCKAQQPSRKRKVKPLQLKNASRQFHIMFVLLYLTGLLFFLLASSPKFRVVSINFASRPEVCQQPAAPAEPWLRNKEPMDGGGAPAAALRAADRCQTIRQACRGGLGRETLLSMSAESPGCLGITKETRKKLSWLDSCKGVSSQDGKNPASLETEDKRTICLSFHSPPVRRKEDKFISTHISQHICK